MVFFTCNACNESMRKSQVEKHYKFQCKRCEYLSCVDCNQEFWGEDYAKHTKCISEDAKYGGKDYVPKANANKGEKKQEAWTEQVQNAINKSKSNPKLKAQLEKLKAYSNIPRKKAKFENFVKNSLRIPGGLVTEMWNAISTETDAHSKSAQVNGSKAENSTSENETENNQSNGVTQSSNSGSSENEDPKPAVTKKISKRDKKEERRKNKNKDEKKDKKKHDDTETKLGKKRKRKHDEIEQEQKNKNELEEEQEETDSTKKKTKKKTKKVKNTEITPPSSKKMKNDSSEDHTEEDISEESPVKKQKFSWEGVIVDILKKADDKQMSVKKLRKKVLSEYAAHHADSPYTEDRIFAKFNKKINKNPMLKVYKEKVTLKT